MAGFNNDKRFDFRLDLPYGQGVERVLANILEQVGTKVEVKADRLVLAYGNLGIEHASRGKPSGIAATEADWWAHVIMPASGKQHEPIAILLFPVLPFKNALRAMVKSGHACIKKGIGKDNTSNIVCVPIQNALRLLELIESPASSPLAGSQ